jgi:hypothetical protein
MRHTDANLPGRPLAATVGSGVLIAAGLFLAACSGESSQRSGASASSREALLTAASSTRPSEEDEPMTLFEKRRLIARLQQDPRALQRLSPRERREVAAMVAAVNRNDDDGDRD